MSERSSGETILAFLLGGIIGAAIGVLYAPSSGKETRKKLKDVADDLRESVDEFVSDIKEKACDEKDRIESAVTAGKKAYEKK